MATTLNKIGSIVVGPGRLNWTNGLWEARSFKEGDDQKKNPDERPSSPNFSAELLFDKGDPKQMKAVELVESTSDAIADAAVRSNKWLPRFKDSYVPCILDCDVDQVQKGFGPNAVWKPIREVTPELVGYWKLRAKRKLSEGRPEMFYLSDNDSVLQLPDPILDPVDEAEEEEAERIREIWGKHVYRGQYASFGVTLYSYTVSQSAGIAAQLNSVFIIGGGDHFATVSFEDQFNRDILSDLAQWKAGLGSDRHASFSLSGVAEPASREQSNGTSGDTDGEPGYGESGEDTSRHARRRRSQGTGRGVNRGASASANADVF